MVSPFAIASIHSANLLSIICVRDAMNDSLEPHIMDTWFSTDVRRTDHHSYPAATWLGGVSSRDIQFRYGKHASSATTHALFY